MGSCQALILIFFFTSLVFIAVTSTHEFAVGGDKGWEVPPSKHASDLYNTWASNNRFQVGDSLRFKYEKDSVMEVTEAEYEKCRSSYPLFFSNSGDSLVKLDRPGAFFFISGISGHCERGEKMIIKVLVVAEAPPPATQTAGNLTSPPANAAHKGTAGPITAAVFLVMLVLVLGLEGSFA